MKEEVKEEISLNYTLNYYKFSKKLPLMEEPFEREFPITSDLSNKVRGYARICSFVICFFMVLLVLVDHDAEEKSSTFTYSNLLSEAFIQILCKVQLILTFIFISIWIQLRKPLALKKY